MLYNQYGPLTAHGVLPGFLNGLVYGQDVVSIALQAFHAIGNGPFGQVRVMDNPVQRGGHSVGIVDQNKQHRKIPDGRQIHGLMYGTFVGGAVSKETGHHLIGDLLHLNGQCGAAGNGAVGAQNAVGAQDAVVVVADMHGAPFTMVGTGLPCQNFRHHCVDVYALSDGLPVAPMCCQHIVSFF